MSRSETSTRSRSNARSASSRIATPATIVGARSGCRPTTRPALGQRHRGEPGEQQLELAELEHVALDAVGVVGVELLCDRGARGRGARPRRRPRRPRLGPRRERRRRGSRAPRPRARAARAGAGGSECRWRSVWRTTPAWVETLKSTFAAAADDELGRAAADVDHQQRAAGRVGRARRSRRGTSAAPPRRRRSCGRRGRSACAPAR